MEKTHTVFEVDPDVMKRVQSFSEIRPYSDKWEEEKASIQQEIGLNAAPTILKAIEERKIRPFYAIGLVEGMDGDNNSLYGVFKSITFMPETYLDNDHSALSSALEDMIETSADRSQFEKDLGELETVFNVKVKNRTSLDRFNSEVSRLKLDFDKIKSKSIGPSLAHMRQRSKEIYENGLGNGSEHGKSFGKVRNMVRSLFSEKPKSDLKPFPNVVGLRNEEASDPFNGSGMGSLLAFTKLMETVRMHEVLSRLDKWIIFKDEKSRKEVVEIGRDIAKYLHDRGLSDVIFVDRAARPAYLSLKENWRHMYPDEKIPDIYFMNPKGFQSKDILAIQAMTEGPQMLMGKMLAEVMKGGEPETPDKARFNSEIKDEVQKKYTRLFKTPNRHVLLYDNCIHSGDSVKPIIDQLTTLGLDVRLGISSDSRNSSGIIADLVCMDRVPQGACYPFDKDEMVGKTFTSVTSKRSTDKSKIAYAKRIRMEIKNAVSEYYL